jgi:hypothetical protein
MRTLTLTGLFLFTFPLGAQTVVGAGYPNPAPVYLAPGELITLYITGLTSTQGITSALQENVNVPAPVLSVSQVSSCPKCVSKRPVGMWLDVGRNCADPV